jgi:hypothetical protein
VFARASRSIMQSKGRDVGRVVWGRGERPGSCRLAGGLVGGTLVDRIGGTLAN